MSVPIKVSVVVPAYNPGDYIEPCIASLLGQTLPADELEIIFVDDGSTDDTPSRLDRLAQQHSHVKVIHQKNSGWPGQPRNVGTDAATGEYVQYVDADDEIPPEALERLYDYARRNDSDVVIGKMVGVGRGAPVEVFRRNRDRATIHDSPIINSLTPHKMFRRSLIVDAGLRHPEGLVRLEDQMFVLAAYFAARNISVLSDYVCYIHNSRSDHGNAAARPFEPRDYFADLRAVLDIVDANTTPGPDRDRLHRRWLRGGMVGRLRGRRLLRRDEEYRRKLFDEIRRVVLERFSPGVDAGLRPVDRLVAALIRRGDFDAILELARWEAGLVLVARLTDAAWRNGALELAVQAELVDSNGVPVPVSTTATGRAIAPPLSAQLLAEVGAPTLVDQLPVALNIVLQHGATGSEVKLPSRRQAHDDETLSLSVRGQLKPAGNAQALTEAVWDVAVRFRALGWNLAAPVTQSEDAPTVPLQPHALGGPGRTLRLCWQESGQLGVDVGPADTSGPHRSSTALQSPLFVALDRLPPPVARRLRGLWRRLKPTRTRRRG